MPASPLKTKLPFTSIRQSGAYPGLDPYSYEGLVNFNRNCSACPPANENRFSQRLHFVDTNLPCGQMTGLLWPWKNLKQGPSSKNADARNNQLFVERYSNKI